MSKLRHTRGFTLIELLVVVAIIALLISILLPSLSAAKEQAKKASCLANLQQIGRATQMYQFDGGNGGKLLPIHWKLLDMSLSSVEYRVINWFAWGGRSGQVPFKGPGIPSNGWLLASDPPPDNPFMNTKPAYDAKNRPLTKYILSSVGTRDQRDLEWFHCPSDQGYPDHPEIDDFPMENAGKPCYDTVGNSYRGSLGPFMLAPGGMMSAGVLGQNGSNLPDPSRLALAGEPLFFNQIGQDDQPDLDGVLIEGWHKQMRRSNVMFCDGSARDTLADKEGEYLFESGAVSKMNANEQFLRRGASWRLDIYPLPGAVIWGSAAEIASGFGASADKWPFVPGR